MPRQTSPVAIDDAEKKRATRIVRLLRREYPDAECALRFSNPLELLIATILSAQTTDKRVNEVTPGLFARYRSAEDYAAADMETFQQEIRSTGFFRNKAKSVIGACQAIAANHGGSVPNTMEELTALPGVGRKTANVVLGNAFGIPGIVVDTHVQRLASRLGFTSEENPDRIEQDLMLRVPRREWTVFSHRLIQHGRQVCMARGPKCGVCVLFSDCRYPGKAARAEKTPNP